MSKADLEALRDKVQNQITLDDAVLATLYALNEPYVTTSTGVLHSLYYEISQNYNIEQLKNLVFNTSPIFPFSSDLYDSFYRLESGRILPFYLTTNIMYDLRESTEILKKSFDKFDENTQEEIKGAARLVLSRASIALKD